MERPQSKIGDWKWATVFIEVVLRAVRRVHYDHGVWGVGRQWEMSRRKARRLNTGYGIELADERTVCAAITQEFMQSPALAGLWVDESLAGAEKEDRYFIVDREKYYTDKAKRVDLFVRKYKRTGKSNELELVEHPSFIEVKRARCWVADIVEGTAQPGDLQIAEVREDIKKLRMEMAARIRANLEHIHSHVLLLGTYENESKKDNPLSFFNNFDDQVKLHQLRWLPLEWTSPSIEDIQRSEIVTPLNKRVLWIALAEVFPAA